MKTNQITATEPVYHLIAMLEDAKKGYSSAAERIRDDVLSLLLERFSCQKERYCNELRQLVKELQIESPIDQITLSLLQRIWMGLKNPFAYERKDIIILGFIKGEETAIINYTQAIEQIQHDHQMRIILERQLNGIKTVINALRYIQVKLLCN